MSLRRTLLIVAALLAIAFGSASVRLSDRGDVGVERTAAACAICGDGVCARSCENKYSCPRDCGGTVSATASGGGR